MICGIHFSTHGGLMVSVLVLDRMVRVSAFDRELYAGVNLAMD